MTEPRHIATVPKNAAEEVRIALTEFNGHELVDVRVFAAIETGGERRATKKGVSLSRRHLPELIRALQAAEREASR
ncbi:transcriptional coactivator p15/PC4 family protein [Methylobacterium sp. GC_Met_2]|uniref:transcriptional coactivator p15/PC4 family protein n=1 Tax=Methylobacterium sp. GC_Met_2 TaxID=2937376 RepID=UPI00226B7180|nr:transcriptional coactivator p15/PC4 family protein [Methylobacterium sp. GC_Met_2]